MDRRFLHPNCLPHPPPRQGLTLVPNIPIPTAYRYNSTIPPSPLPRLPQRTSTPAITSVHGANIYHPNSVIPPSPLPRLPQHTSTPTITSVHGANVYHPNSVIPPSASHQLLQHQQNSTFNHSYQNIYLLQTELNSLRKRNAKLEQDNSRLWGLNNNSNTVPKEQYDEVLIGNKTVAANNDKLVQTSEKLWNENKMLLQKIEELNKKLALKKENLGGAQNECEQLTKNNNELVKKGQELEQSLEASEKNLESVHQKISSLEKSHATALKELEDNVSKGKLEVLMLERELEEERNKVNLLNDESEYFHDQEKDLKGQKAALQAEYEQFKSQKEEEVTNLNLQLKSSGEKVNLLADENVNLKAKIRIFESEMATLQTKGEQSNSENERHNRKYEKLSSENLALKKKNVELTEKLKLVTEKCEEVTKRKEELVQTVAVLKIQIKFGEATVKAFEKKFTDSQNVHDNESKKQDEDLAEANDQIRILEKKLKTSKERLDLLTSEKKKNISENREKVSKSDEKKKQAEDELHEVAISSDYDDDEDDPGPSRAKKHKRSVNRKLV